MSNDGLLPRIGGLGRRVYYKGVEIATRESSRALLRSMSPLLPTFRWSVDRVDRAPDAVSVHGWALRLQGDGRHDFELVFNGRRPARVERFERADLGSTFPEVAMASAGGFVAVFPSSGEVEDGRSFEFVAREVRDGAAVGPAHAIYQLAPEQERWPFPDDTRITRVQGGPHVESFARVGFTTFMQLQQAYERVAGRPLASVTRILDWGCGCGRLLRYLERLSGPELVGADIDSDNIAWCRTHLPFASYDVLPLRPPTPLQAGAFDVVIGISVFTHLTEQVQKEWLAELARVTKPGSVLLMTIHGPGAAAFRGTGRLLRKIRDKGFCDGDSADLHEVLSEQDRSYYRTTYHMHEYIRDVWSQWFDVVEIVPSLIGWQDLVVLKGR